MLILPTNQPTKQPTNQATTQASNQPTNQPTIGTHLRRCQANQVQRGLVYHRQARARGRDAVVDEFTQHHRSVGAINQRAVSVREIDSQRDVRPAEVTGIATARGEVAGNIAARGQAHAIHRE